MVYINYNGKVTEAKLPIIEANNRGLRYGDGVFETLKLVNNQLILANEHFERLWSGLALLQFKIPIHFTAQKLQQQILELTRKNKLSSARVRLTVIRGTGGIYDATNHNPNYIIETFALPTDNGPLNSNGLQLCFYTDAKKPIDCFSNIKHNNYLPYFMGALFAKNNKCNDAIILNTEANICDTTIANIFYLKDTIIYTPAVNQGCVSGVLRNWLIQHLPALGFRVVEKIVTKADILSADEVFLTNSIYNIRWVKTIENSQYSVSQTQQISIALINKYSHVMG